MIFKPEMVEKILAGEKTVTRRPIRTECIEPFGGFGEFTTVARICRYKVGRIYAVQPGRCQKGVARICIKDVRRGLLAGIEDRDALLEGFASRQDFRVYWEALYGSFNSTQLVDRIEFELVPDSGAGS